MEADIQSRLRKEAEKQIRTLFKGTTRISIRHTGSGTLGTATYPGGIKDYIYVKHSGLRLSGTAGTYLTEISSSIGNRAV